MKDWKTTLAGILTALPFLIDALITAYNAGFFENKTGFQLAIGIAIVVLGVIMKDPKMKSK